MLDMSQILELGKKSKGRIGIGSGSRSDIVRSCVGESRSRGLPAVDVYESAESLCDDLKSRKICAAVRGTLSSNDILPMIKSTFGIPKVLRVAFLSTSRGKPFLLAPVGIDEGNSLEERFEIMMQGVKFLRCLGVTPTISVLSKGRQEDSARGEEIARSLREGEALTELASNEGLVAKHEHILVEKAAEETDFVMAPDGVTGNLIFRSLYFLGGGAAWGAPVVNIGKVFVDTSRDKRTYLDSIALAAALCAARERTGQVKSIYRD